MDASGYISTGTHCWFKIINKPASSATCEVFPLSFGIYIIHICYIDNYCYIVPCGILTYQVFISFMINTLTYVGEIYLLKRVRQDDDRAVNHETLKLLFPALIWSTNLRTALYMSFH